MNENIILTLPQIFRLEIQLVKAQEGSQFGVMILKMNFIHGCGTINLIWFRWRMLVRTQMDLNFL